MISYVLCVFHTIAENLHDSVDKGRDHPDSEEGITILSPDWVHTEALEEEGRHPAPSGGGEGGTRGVVGSLPQQSWGWTSWNAAYR